MIEYTARELIEEIKHQAEMMPEGLGCKILVGDIECNHSDAHHLQITGNVEMNAIEILCDPDEVC